MKKWSILMLLFIFAITGCGVQNDETAGTGMLNGQDELPGRTMSDQNPNLVNTGSERNHAREIEHVQKAIADTNEFTPDSIWINGNTLWVTATTEKRLSGKEKVDAQARLHKIVMKAAPRYNNIEVRVNED
jgi:hypothetical protein